MQVAVASPAPLYLWAQSWLAPLLAVAVSLACFLSCRRGDGMWRRLLVSVHGVAIAALYFGALCFFWTNHANPAFRDPFLLALLLPLLLMAVSLVLYRGQRAVHLLQLVNLGCLAWTYFIGGMAVSGIWL